jgi:uroporphyrin-III C-methyltransferase
VSFRADLELSGRSVLVCGAGAPALAPIRNLLDAAASVTVVGAAPVASITDLAGRGQLILLERAVESGDLTSASLIVPATGDAKLDSTIVGLAKQVSAPCVIPAETVQLPEEPQTGSVILVGGGPGDPGLITLAGLEAVRRADVIVSDRLAPLSILRHAKSSTEIIDVAKIPRGAHTSQERINAILVEHAHAGRTVVRLKGGDSFVFGRGGEEWQACAEEGVAVTVIPGVTSATAAPALAGIPLTHRQLTQGFTVISGHVPPGHSGSTLDWAALARLNTTLVIMMGVATLPAITAELIKYGMAGDTPAATVADAGMPTQRTVIGSVADIAERTITAGLAPPAITVIGAVAAFRAVSGKRRPPDAASVSVEARREDRP